MTIIWPPWKPPVRSSSSRKPVGTPSMVPSCFDATSISVERALEEVANREVVLGVAALGDREDLRLRAVDDVVDLGAVGVVAHVGDARAGLDEAAQDRLLANKPCVVPGRRCGRYRRNESVEVLGSANAGDLAVLCSSAPTVRASTGSPEL